MKKENWDIQFIKPCRYPEEEHWMLTPEYTVSAIKNRKIVQINLDNCSIQRMEELPEEATVKDVEEVGLLPLYEILNSGMVSLTCIGLNEMPDWRVEGARAAYERFCRKFWPGHQDDKDATFRPYDPNSKERKVKFTDLEDGARCTYGSAYVSVLQIQNILLNYPELSPTEKFEAYLHGITHLLGIVSAFELEIAKYAFWDLRKSEINQLSSEIKQRRKDIRENFAKTRPTLSKCKEFSFDAAMDVQWLSGANLSEDLGATIEIEGMKFELDNWVGTNDYKLYRISRDIHSTMYGGSTMKRLAYCREEEIAKLPYWKRVDDTAKNILQYRDRNGHANVDNLLSKIDKAVLHLEEQIHDALERQGQKT